MSKSDHAAIYMNGQVKDFVDMKINIWFRDFLKYISVYFT